VCSYIAIKTKNYDFVKCIEGQEEEGFITMKPDEAGMQCAYEGIKLFEISR
jgi:hypothetical protein